MKKFTRKAMLTALVSGVLLTAGIAFAAWTATGSGSGYAQATSAQELTTVDASADTTAQLYPGGKGDLVISITNPNAYAVTVSDITGNGAIVTTDANAACDASTGVTFDNQSGLSLAVPAGSTGTEFTLTDVVHMSNGSDNACQGEIFDVPVSLLGASS